MSAHTKGNIIMTHSISVPYSGTWEVPDSVTFAWGARLIITQQGDTDLLWDRQGATAEVAPAAWTSLSNWLDGGAIKHARSALSQMLAEYRLSTRETREVVLYGDDKGIIMGNPRSSAGYCYILAYLTTWEPIAFHEESGK